MPAHWRVFFAKEDKTPPAGVPVKKRLRLVNPRCVELSMVPQGMHQNAHALKTPKGEVFWKADDSAPEKPTLLAELAAAAHAALAAGATDDEIQHAFEKHAPPGPNSGTNPAETYTMEKFLKMLFAALAIPAAQAVTVSKMFEKLPEEDRKALEATTLVVPTPPDVTTILKELKPEGAKILANLDAATFTTFLKELPAATRDALLKPFQKESAECPKCGAKFDVKMEKEAHAHLPPEIRKELDDQKATTLRIQKERDEEKLAFAKERRVAFEKSITDSVKKLAVPGKTPADMTTVILKQFDAGNVEAANMLLDAYKQVDEQTKAAAVLLSKERGYGGGNAAGLTEGTASYDLEQKAHAYAKEKKISFEKAYTVVLDENPELAARVDQEDRKR